MRITERVIRRLPKTDLHCHLDGCLRPRTVLELAEAQGVKLPTRNLAQLTRLLKAGKRTRNLGDYLKIFDITLSVMQEKEALYRVAYELAEDAAAENVRHLEVRYSPILHRKRRLAFEDIVDPVIAGPARRGHASYGMTTGVIICGIRSMDPKFSLALAELAVAYKGTRRAGLRPGGAGEGLPGQGAPRGVPADPQEQHQLDGARRRGVRPGRASRRRSTTAARTASGTARGCARTAT